MTSVALPNSRHHCPLCAREASISTRYPLCYEHGRHCPPPFRARLRATWEAWLAAPNDQGRRAAHLTVLREVAPVIRAAQRAEDAAEEATMEGDSRDFEAQECALVCGWCAEHGTNPNTLDDCIACPTCAGTPQRRPDDFDGR